jgi:glycosyltransferase involved in cell wall biosynthesis
MQLLRQRGHELSLVVLSPLGEYLRPSVRRRWRERQRYIRDELELPVSRLPSPPSRAKALWSNALLLRGRLALQRHHARKTILHCRGAEAAKIALEASLRDPSLPIVFDCRGLAEAECLYVNGFSSLDDAPPDVRAVALARRKAERDAARYSLAVICVSEAMKRELQRVYDTPAEKIRVVYCCTDTQLGTEAAAKRETTRSMLGLQDRFVVVYNGSLAAWQMTGETLQAFRMISGLRPNAHFLAVTTQPRSMEMAAEDAGIAPTQRTIVSVPYQEVANHVAAADLALLIRDDSIVNRVASPVKFAEYLASGVPVAITKHVGDYSDLVGKRGVGTVLPDLGEGAHKALSAFLQAQQQSPGAIRQACMEAAHEVLDWRAATDTISRIYEDLGASRAGEQDRS